ncbi:hypothetical protein FC83_GL001356 [Agrilactobacillus composti DSM 18527 = JCM 14202]|jgi:energy-coupling factor transporter transmembrane protein EcfT|uniref:Uncharacterized protein n=1 Tax=Agrilactobacillus composti DSM 18527 = JCM 14202 TaxID=1423734 RepID=X0PQ13_9LACO|nr:hypothetical protein [Agrilactobacillus composti]KRM30798.1 hypothetical protein FC83_GL001356 [Agrilactobacillus composti DSM 18527 = JCM 14202]MCH4170813.1 hypothetical protein [Lactobacillus sp.]GAF39792.1 hypothetical protein JCM14202_1668 [Agrilactobacillus composti DSM 18527 = JCM 14202]
MFFQPALATAATNGNGHSLGGAVMIGAIVALVLILFLIVKLFGLILRHPFISIGLFALGGFTVFKFALSGILILGVIAAVGVASLWFNWGNN